MDEALTVLEQAMDRCLVVPLWARSPDAVVGYLDRVQALEQQLAALKLALVRDVDGRGVALQQGAANLVSWLRDRYRVSAGAANRSVKLARVLDPGLRQVSAALHAGALNVEQAQVIADAVTRVPDEVREDAERQLVDEAVTFGPKELGRLGERILEHVAPQLAERQAEGELARLERDAFGGRDFNLVDQPGTCRVRIHGWLDREGAAHLRAALDPLTAPCRTKQEPDLRSPGQRRADGLVELSRRLLATKKLPDNGGDRPQIVITMDYHQLRANLAAATLDDGGQLSPATVRRLACDANIIPAVLKGAGQVLDLGRERRLISGHLRRALVVRDRGCAFPGCDRPPRWCDAHHVKHWIDHGRSSLDNAVLLCRHHHRLIHHSEWGVKIVNRLPVFIPPEYVDEKREPLTNPIHRRR